MIARGAAAESRLSPVASAGTRSRAAAIPVLEHLRGLSEAVAALEEHADHLADWGRELHCRLRGGGRLLAAGNGGSAAEAQHLTAELVGRYRGEREAYSAIALSAETSSLTAIGNDYGFDEVFARQVGAHARSGDVVILLSTSGASENLVRAAHAARRAGAASWALTGCGRSPLADACDDAIRIAGQPPHVQECQLAAVHALCEVFDAHCRAESARRR